MIGKIADAWSTYSGFTALQARYRDQTTSSLNETEPAGIPEIMGKFYLEYAPSLVRGTVLSGGLIYTGPQIQNAGLKADDSIVKGSEMWGCATTGPLKTVRSRSADSLRM